jgi:Aspartyl protease/PDZ domain
MKLRLSVVGLALGTLLLGSGCISRRDLRPGRTELSTHLISVPARIIGSHFIVDGKWDKRGPWHFLVDTGSSVTLVSDEFARRYASGKAALGAPLVRVTSADGNSTLLPAVTIRRIELAEARFENVQALVRDFGDISAHLGVKIDGVLAFPLFRQTVFTLDYPASKLLLSPIGEPPYLPGSTIKFNNVQRTPLIPIKVGDITLVALIDSGSDGPLLLNPSGLDLRFSTPPRPGTVVGTLTGNRLQQIGRLALPLAVGAYQFPQPIVELTDQLSALGGEILSHFAVTFDQARNQVTFHRGDYAPIITPPRRSCGLAFSKGPTYWRVVGVVAGSPADQAGIKEGELVTRIDGDSITNWPLARFEPFLKRSPEIVFTFLDGAKETPVVIPTFELVQ